MNEREPAVTESVSISGCLLGRFLRKALKEINLSQVERESSCTKKITDSKRSRGWEQTVSFYPGGRSLSVLLRNLLRPVQFNVCINNLGKEVNSKMNHLY